jgi:hypothetical protein
MKIEIEIPDPPAGCDPAEVKWGVPPIGAMAIISDVGAPRWRMTKFAVHGETAWVMPYTPGFLGLLKPGWVTYELNDWRWFRDRPHWSGNQWYNTTHTYTLPFREVPPVSGKDAIWEVPHD